MWCRPADPTPLPWTSENLAFATTEGQTPRPAGRPQPVSRRVRRVLNPRRFAKLILLIPGHRWPLSNTATPTALGSVANMASCTTPPGTLFLLLVFFRKRRRSPRNVLSHMNGEQRYQKFWHVRSRDQGGSSLQSKLGPAGRTLHIRNMWWEDTDAPSGRSEMRDWLGDEDGGHRLAKKEHGTSSQERRQRRTCQAHPRLLAEGVRPLGRGIRENCTCYL